MMLEELDVLISGEHAGMLSQDDSGQLSFAYLQGYRGVPLSSAMPLSTRTYRDKTVRPYLWGLLPEDQAARKAVAANAEVSPNNPFALLGIIGLDCPGAVQFCPPGENAAREEKLVPSTMQKSRGGFQLAARKALDGSRITSIGALAANRANSRSEDRAANGSPAKTRQQPRTFSKAA